jgi:ComF family protein
MQLHGESRHIRLNSWLKSWSDLIDLIYPRSCIVCKNELAKTERNCCNFCIQEFPYTYFEKFREPTDLDKLFWGRVKVHSTFSLLYFEKEKGSQFVLHDLKYKHNYALGIEMGKLIAKKLSGHSILQGVDALIPVPIHHRKKFIRGYNQSEALAHGIEKLTGIKVINDFVAKNKHTGSQTRKGRFLRWDNVSDQFSINKFPSANVKHIAIIDDVITTGATIEALISVIQKNYPEIRISVISLAIAK